MKPFFSVIIPTLNEEKYLATILQSLSKQTYRGFELIVVDGDSVDKTKKVFAKYNKLMPRARYIHAEKRNVAYQRNLGARTAGGEYFIFLDADVDIGLTFLEELHVAAVKNNFGFATTWILPDSTKTVDNLMIQLANLGVELAKSINKPISGGYNTIVRKDVFRKLRGFRENLPISEDHDFTIRAHKKNIDILILKEPRVVYSLRRFRSQGTLSVLRKYALATTHLLLKGPITSELFEYEMGGHVHKFNSNLPSTALRLDSGQALRASKTSNSKLKTYFNKIYRLQKQIVNLLNA